jgi:hypothetical protein
MFCCCSRKSVKPSTPPPSPVAPTHAELVSILFADARDLYFAGADRDTVREAFRAAWRAYKTLSPEEQALVVK